MKARKYLPPIVTAAICTLYLTVFFTQFTVQTFPNEFEHDEEPAAERFLIGYNIAYYGDFYFTNHSLTPIPYDKINMIVVEQPGPKNDTLAILSKTLEPSEDVMNTQSFHKERLQSGPNNDKNMILSKPIEHSEGVVNIQSFHKERPHSGPNNENVVTRPKLLQSAASVQKSSGQGVRTKKGPLTVREVLLLPPEPEPVPVPPTVKVRRIKNGNRDILQLSPTSPQTDTNVHKDVFTSKDLHFERTILDRLAGTTDEQRGQTLATPSHRLSQNTNVPDSQGNHFKSVMNDQVGHENESSVSSLRTHKRNTDTGKHTSGHFHDNKHTGSHKSYQMKMAPASFDKSTTKPSFRKAYTNPNFTQKSMPSMQGYSYMNGRLLEHGTRISNNSSVNTTAGTEHLVREPRAGEKSKVKLSNFISRHIHPERHNAPITQQNINVSPTAEHNQKPNGFEGDNNGLHVAGQAILRKHDKSNMIPFFQTKNNNPGTKQRAVEQPKTVPFLRQPEIPTILTGSTVPKVAFDNYNKIPFLRQPEILTTPTLSTVQTRVFNKHTDIPFLRQPEIPTTPTLSTVQTRVFDKHTDIPFLRQPEIPTTPTRSTVQTRVFDKHTNIPFLRQPEIPTTPTLSTVQTRVFDKHTNIPFLRQPEIPTTPTLSTVQIRVFDTHTDIPFLRQPEIPTTPTLSTAQQRASDRHSNIPFVRKPDIPTTPITPNVQQRAFKNVPKIQNIRPPSEPTLIIDDRLRDPSQVSYSSFGRQVNLRKLPTNAAKASDEDTSTPMQHLRQPVPTSGPSNSKEQTQQELLYLDMEIDYNRESTIVRNGIFRVRRGESQEPYSSRQIIKSKKRSISAPHVLHSPPNPSPKITGEENINNDTEMASKVLPVPDVTHRSTPDIISNLAQNSIEAKLSEKDKDGEDLDMDIREGNADLDVGTGSPPQGDHVITSQGETQNVQIEAFERPAVSAESHLPLPTLQYSRNEPGEFGAPVTVDYDKLSDRRRLQYADGYKQNYFNQFVSDMVSVRRRLLDDRPTRTKFSLGKLPEVSVIISFHNEAWSTLLRSIHSVLDRSPPELLREIILVDDLSNKSYLKTPLEEYIATLVKVKLIRTKTRQGVARARLVGYSIAQAPVLIFMDSHTECFPGWLEPLLEGISLDSTTVTFPVITPIDPHDFSSRTSLPKHRGGFRWEGLRFMWDAFPAHQQNRTETDPIRSPTIPGGVFAISKNFFEKLGGFDPGMMFWGGENLELSFKVWMCNGSVHLLPCSQVGHVFRSSNPVTWPNRQDVANINSARVAEVWMDDYKSYLYDASFLKPDNYGDISSRQALRQRLRCHDFHWYMRTVYPDKHVPFRLLASGELRPTGSGLCVTSRVGQSGRLQLISCHGQGENQLWQVTLQGDFQQNNIFVCTSDMTSLHLERTCADRHNWEYRKDGTMYHRLLQLCLQANPDGSVEITICDSSSSQQWNMTRT